MSEKKKKKMSVSWLESRDKDLCLHDVHGCNDGSLRIISVANANEKKKVQAVRSFPNFSSY